VNISNRPKKILYSYHVVTLHLHKITRIISLNQVAHFSLIYHQTNLQDPSMNGATVV